MFGHSERQKRHEDIYRKTVSNAIEGVRQGAFHEDAVPAILQGIREELDQCADLLLISPEFHSEQNERIQNLASVAMQY